MALTDRDALIALTAERAMVGAWTPRATRPVGALARVGDGRMLRRPLTWPARRSHWIRDALEGDAAEPAALGRAVAERLLAAGAAELLAAGGARAAAPT